MEMFEIIMSIVWVALALAVVFVIFQLSRPATVNEGAEGYDLVNDFTGWPMLSGRVFKTQSQAEAAADRLLKKNTFALPVVIAIHHT